MKTWWMILRTSLEERLAYRGDFALGTLMRFLPIITQIFLWSAVYASVGDSLQSDVQESSQAGGTQVVAEKVERRNGPAEAGTPAQAAGDEVGLGNRPAEAGTPAQDTGDEVELGGYTLAGMVAYYLITMIGRAFSSMPGLASGIARQIREGEIKRYLIQPVDFVGFLMLQRVAHKVAYYTVAILPFALVFFLCRGYFTSGWPPAPQFLAFLATLVMGFLIGFFLEATIGMIGFWFLEVSSLLFIYMLFSFFLSGHMFPLTLLPDSIEWFVQLLPLKYLAYFPAAVFLGKIPPEELPLELAIEAAWLLFFIFTCRFSYAAGVRRYSGYGG
ncbi:ABC transporter permease [Planctomycetaceae bacterium SH139]